MQHIVSLEGLMWTYDTSFDFTAAKSQKGITKPSVVTGQKPKKEIPLVRCMIQHTREKC